MVEVVRRHYRFILALYGLMAVLVPGRLLIDTPAVFAFLTGGYIAFALALIFGLVGLYRLATRQPISSYRLCMAALAVPVVTHLALRI